MNNSNFHLGEVPIPTDGSTTTPFPNPYPGISPLGTRQDGFFKLYETDPEKRKFVREQADPNSEWISSVYAGNLYPCYGSRQGTNGKEWYYIWVESDGIFGWVSSNLGFISY